MFSGNQHMICMVETEKRLICLYKGYAKPAKQDPDLRRTITGFTSLQTFQQLSKLGICPLVKPQEALCVITPYVSSFSTHETSKFASALNIFLLRNVVMYVFITQITAKNANGLLNTLRLSNAYFSVNCHHWFTTEAYGLPNIKIPSYQYRDPHIKYKTVSRLSYL